MKSEIIRRLGETSILLPSLIHEGLAANDRVKLRLSVLQDAGRHARNPATRFGLKDECLAAGIDPVPLEALVNHASLAASTGLTAPGLGMLVTGIFDDVATMLKAVQAGDPDQGDALQTRYLAIKAGSLPPSPDTLDVSDIARLTGVSGDGDGLHRLIMDLHKALNHLAAAHAEETLAGAHVYGLQAEDRACVESFMRGVHATSPLKFNHPGLATTASRSGQRLIIQNDIGATDAHVVVIAVEPDVVTITYTDVHLARAKFFTGLFRDFQVEWSGLDRQSWESRKDEGIFYLVTGRYRFEDASRRDSFLETVGGSLVFLIDWNKARKLLRTMIPNGDAIRVLNWAARNRFGHRGFLELGGCELVAAAVHHATPARIGFGERLDQALGRDAAVDFLKTVLRVSAEALLEGSSVRLARDRIEADLVRHLERIDGKLLAIVVRQAGLAREIAVQIAQFIAERKEQRSLSEPDLACRARHIEEKADKIAIEARREIAHVGASSVIESLVNRIEDSIDELEQAAFIASLIPSGVTKDMLEPLAGLCASAVSAAEAAAAGAAAAADVAEGQRVDSEDALAAASRLLAAEHESDIAERQMTALVLQSDFDLKAALSLLELARALERATDRLAGFAHHLREHVLAELTA